MLGRVKPDEVMQLLSAVTRSNGLRHAALFNGLISLLKGKAENDGVEESFEIHVGLLASSITDELDIHSDVTGICVLPCDDDWMTVSNE